jgi:hypothetical protein
MLNVRPPCPHEMKALSDDQPFLERLSQTVAWCLLRGSAVDPARSLRSRELFPDLLAPDRASVVVNVVRRRASALPGMRVSAIRSHGDLRGGRLLAYFPDATLADGAAETQSRGFFDGNNTPPWDTWVGLFRSDSLDPSDGIYLISYVPANLLRFANEGIEVNPEQCIQWLGRLDTPIGNVLRSDGWSL